MPLPEKFLTRPPAGASPTEHGMYWLAVAEEDYESRRYDEATAAAHIAAAHFAKPVELTFEPGPLIPASEVAARIGRVEVALAVPEAPPVNGGQGDVPA